jgi:hypothetical protein
MLKYTVSLSILPLLALSFDSTERMLLPEEALYSLVSKEILASYGIGCHTLLLLIIIIIIILIEPLSTPKQRRSLLLVDPKKGDSSLRDIVNGTNNSIPATQRLSIPALPSTGFPHAERHSLTMKPKNPRMINANSRTAPSNVAADYEQQQRGVLQQRQQQQEQQQQQQRLLAEQVKKRQEEIDIQLKEQREKIQQYEAAKREKQERERLERALKEQQLAEQIMAAEQALADERERLQREQERVEAEQQKARREARIKEIEIGRQRRAAIHSQVKRRLANQLAAAVAKETVRGAIRAMYRRHDLAKRYTKDWLPRARQSIQVRHLKRNERIQQHHFSTFFGSKGGGASIYRTPRLWNDSFACNGATIDDVIHEKASLSLDLETSALASHNVSWKAKSNRWLQAYLLLLVPSPLILLLTLMVFGTLSTTPILFTPWSDRNGMDCEPAWKKTVRNLAGSFGLVWLTMLYHRRNG